MRAIWRDRLYLALDTRGDEILLEDVDTGQVRVRLSDSTLVIYPTDDEVAAAREVMARPPNVASS